MRVHLTGILVALSGALLVTACGGSESSPTGSPGEDPGNGPGASSGGVVGPDASTEPDPDPNPGPGPDGPSAPVTLKSGPAFLIGITSGSAPHAIYIVPAAGGMGSLEAVPVGGGAPTVIAPELNLQNDAFTVSGGAVAYWTNIAADGTNDLGTLHLWTKAGGKKENVSTTSIPSLFVANEDGSKVAFSPAVSAAGTHAGVAVTNAADPSTTTVIPANTTGINLIAARPVGNTPPVCSPQLGFVKKIFFGAYCTANTANARIVTVPDGAAAPTRIDAASGLGTARPLWSADESGTKLFTIGSGVEAQGRIITVAGAANVDVENDTLFGLMLNDGSGILYRTADGMKRAAAAGDPNPITLVAGAKSFLGLSSDQKRFLTRTLDPDQGNVDIRAANTTGADQTPTDIVATASARPQGFTGAGGHVLYVTDVGETGGKLKVKPAAGGAEKELAQAAFGAAAAPEGNAVLVIQKPESLGQGTTVVELAYVDAASPKAPELVTDGALVGSILFSGKTVVYTRLAEQGAGLYSVTLP